MVNTRGNLITYVILFGMPPIVSHNRICKNYRFLINIYYLQLLIVLEAHISAVFAIFPFCSSLSCLSLCPFKMFSWKTSQFLQENRFPCAAGFISQRRRNPDNPEQSTGKSLTLSTDVSASYFQVLKLLSIT